MKFVSLCLVAIMISFGSSAQSGKAAEKRTVTKQQNTKSKNLKIAKAKLPAAKTADVVTLNNETSHKAKWTFEEMLKRRQEIDAEESGQRQN